jgi:hypothetical protein
MSRVDLRNISKLYVWKTHLTGKKNELLPKSKEITPCTLKRLFAPERLFLKKTSPVRIRGRSNAFRSNQKMATPGLKFFAEPMAVQPSVGLAPTMSTYSYGDRLEGEPKYNELYIVCKDGSIQSIYDPSKPIGWELFEEDSQWFYRVTQMNHKPHPCLVRYHSTDPNPPKGRGKIGSVVMMAYRSTVDTPQEAEITEQKDNDLEVISKYSPYLAEATMIANDPVQTAAMAKFARGHMSYAEMRGLCG